jgi:hypothetical protein
MILASAYVVLWAKCEVRTLFDPSLWALTPTPLDRHCGGAFLGLLDGGGADGRMMAVAGEDEAYHLLFSI